MPKNDDKYGGLMPDIVKSGVKHTLRDHPYDIDRVYGSSNNSSNNSLDQYPDIDFDRTPSTYMSKEDFDALCFFDNLMSVMFLLSVATPFITYFVASLYFSWFFTVLTTIVLTVFVFILTGMVANYYAKLEDTIKNKP